MNYYNEIKNKLIDDEVYSRVKDCSKEKHKVKTYFEIGKLLNEAGAKYGDSIIKNYANRLIIELGKKYNERTLRRIRQYYRMFKDEKWSPVATKLTWSHYSELLSIKDENTLIYYINISLEKNLTKRELREIIKNKEYQRLPIETKEKLITKEKVKIKDLVPNPILIKNKNNIEIVTEKVLHNLILEDIESFMKELGNSFCFVGSEFKIKLGNKYNYIDLLLYNIKYKCYVVVELKVTELKKEHTGQIQTYMNYINDNIKTIDENETVGIIICKQDNEYVIKYCTDNRIISRTYELI